MKDRIAKILFIAWVITVFIFYIMLYIIPNVADKL